MKFTSQEEYGLRCVLYLARRLGESAESAGADPASALGASDAVPLSDIALSEGVSEQYVGKLLRVLADAGIVESVRGRSGGFRLARAPVEITAAEVLAALGDQIFESTTCDRFRGKKSFCVHTNQCSLRSLWSGLQVLLDQVLSRTTVADLVGSERTMAQWMRIHIEALSDLSERLDEAPPANDGRRLVEWAPTSTSDGREPLDRGESR